MARIEEAPTVEAGARGETITRHPAFGQISYSQITGQTFLYGSDFSHNGSIAVRISTSELKRDLAQDWFNTTGTVVEVCLSEAQWAAFISSPNRGQGVPCTIRSLNGKAVPEVSAPPSRAEQFDGEVAERGARIVAALDALDAALSDAKVSDKQRAVLKNYVRTARQEVISNMPFVLRSFAEHAETIVTRAKTEVSAYAWRTLTRMGLDALLGPERSAELLSLPTATSDEEHGATGGP